MALVYTVFGWRAVWIWLHQINRKPKPQNEIECVPLIDVYRLHAVDKYSRQIELFINMSDIINESVALNDILKCYLFAYLVSVILCLCFPRLHVRKFGQLCLVQFRAQRSGLIELIS